MFSVLLPDGETWNTVKVLRCLKEIPGVRVHVLSRNRFPLSRFSRYCTEVHVHQSGRDAEWLEAVRSVSASRGIDLVMPVNQYGVEFVARNHDEVSRTAKVVALPDFESIQLLSNKWLAYKYAQGIGLPVPESQYLGKYRDDAEIPASVDGFEYPALLKPTSMDSGRGIVRINDNAELRRVWQNGYALAKGEEYLLQSFIPGIDLCLGVFCRNGKILAYTVQRSMEDSERYFGPQRIMKFVEDEGVLDCGGKLLRSLGYNGVAFIDFRIDSRDQTRKLIEINPRIGGAVLGSLTAGVNFPLLWCLDAIGEPLPDIHYMATSYAHPTTYVAMMIGRLFGKSQPTAVRWRQSGLRFSVSDPAPDLIYALRKAIRLGP